MKLSALTAVPKEPHHRPTLHHLKDIKGALLDPLKFAHQANRLLVHFHRLPRDKLYALILWWTAAFNPEILKDKHSHPTAFPLQDTHTLCGFSNFLTSRGGWRVLSQVRRHLHWRPPRVCSSPTALLPLSGNKRTLEE